MVELSSTSVPPGPTVRSRVAVEPVSVNVLLLLTETFPLNVPPVKVTDCPFDRFSVLPALTVIETLAVAVV